MDQKTYFNSILPWIVLLAAAGASWDVVLSGGFMLSGWLWLFTGIVFIPYAIIQFRASAQISLYLLFLLIAYCSLLWSDVVDRDSVQECFQFSFPLLVWVIATQLGKDSRTVNDKAFPLLPLFVATGILLIPFLAEMIFSTAVFKVRSSAITMTAFAACFLDGILAGDRRGWFGFVAAFIVCLITVSRMATFAILGMLLLSQFAGKLRILHFIKTLAVIFVIGIVFYSQPVQERFFFGGSGGFKDVFAGNFDTSGRFNLWPDLLHGIEQRPFWGHGSSSSRLASLRIACMGHPHNDYLRILYDFGLMGFLPFWGFFVYKFVYYAYCIRKRHFQICVAPFLAISGFFCLALTDNLVEYTTNFMYPLMLMVGLADGAVQKARYLTK
jgi:O-antigen ligase